MFHDRCDGSQDSIGQHLAQAAAEVIPRRQLRSAGRERSAATAQHDDGAQQQRESANRRGRIDFRGFHLEARRDARNPRRHVAFAHGSAGRAKLDVVDTHELIHRGDHLVGRELQHPSRRVRERETLGGVGIHRHRPQGERASRYRVADIDAALAYDCGLASAE